MTPLSRRAFLAASLAASGAALAGPRRLWRSANYFPWEEIRPGFWAAASPSQGGNVLAVKGKQGSLLIDSKFAGMAATLRREASDRAGAVRALLNTHHHGDHTGGNLAFHDDVETYAHAAAIDRIKNAFEQYLGQVRGAERQVAGGGEVTDEIRAELESLLARESELRAELWVPRHDVAEVVAQERAQTLGKPEELLPGIALVAHHFGPGHTDNDLAVFFPDADVLHTGDLCFHGRHPFFDPSGGATIRGWTKSLEGMLAHCTADTIVVPGHGPIGEKAIIQKQIDYMSSLASAVEKELAGGRSRDEVVAMTWPFMDGLGDQGRARAVGAVYDELLAEKGGR